MSPAGAREWLSPTQDRHASHHREAPCQGEGHGWLYRGGRDRTHSTFESDLGMWSVGAKPEETRFRAESLLRRAQGWSSLARLSRLDVQM